MIRSLCIEGYRGFDRFEMDGLAPVNLLVGKNNSGKTSILEAIRLLASKGNRSVLWDVMTRRGEELVEEQKLPQPRLQIDVCHLFRGHKLDPGVRFSITAAGERVDHGAGSRRAPSCFYVSAS